MKKRFPPCTPYREKAKGKETIPGFFQNHLSPRGRASERTGERARGRVSRYRIAGGVADELILRLGADPGEDNRRLWAYYCYHNDIDRILDKADRLASEHRQGELDNPVTAFQSWLTKTFGKEAT